MRRIFAAAAVTAVALIGFQVPGGADPLPPGPRNLSLVTPGPTIGGCPTAVEARIIIPDSLQPADMLERPLWLTHGAQAGTLLNPCTQTYREIRVSTELWFLPLLGPAQLVAVGGSHGNCQGDRDPTTGTGGCNRAQSFGGDTAVPGIYQIRGYVQFKEVPGNFGPVYSFDGDRFFYDIYSIEKI